MDYIEKLIAWEEGKLKDKEVLELFGELIKNGKCWTLPGVYGRQAQTFINDNWISETGEVDWGKYEEILGEYETKNEEV